MTGGHDTRSLNGSGVDEVGAGMHERRPAAPAHFWGWPRSRLPDPLWGGLGLLAGALVTVLVAVLVIPGGASTQPDPGEHGALPGATPQDSYVAETAAGVLAALRLDGGPPVGVVARFPTDRVRDLAVSAGHVYAVAEHPDRQEVVEFSGGPMRVLRSEKTRVRALSAASGRVAYLVPDANEIVRSGRDGLARIAVPPQRQVDDLALAPDGRLAVLVSAPGRPASARLHVLPAGSNTTEGTPGWRVPVGCGPLAVSWPPDAPAANGAVALAVRSTCAPSAPLRVVTLDAATGRQRSASRVIGVRDSPAADPSDPPRLSTAVDGRWLLSAHGGHLRWWFDGDQVRRLPDTCRSARSCGPAALVR